MERIIAFIKAHRRDMIIAASTLAASLVVILLVPALIIGNVSSAAGMMACLTLFFMVDPAFCLAAAIFAGWDIRRRWYTTLFPPLVFLLSTRVVFAAEASGFLVYFIIYSAVILTATPFTFLVRKYGKTDE